MSEEKPKQRSIATQVFWGLFLFFIVMPAVLLSVAALIFGVAKGMHDHAGSRAVTSSPR